MNQTGDLIKDNTNSESEVRSLAPYREPASQFPIDADWDPEEPKLGFRDYWLMVRSRIWLIMAITLLVTTLSVIYVAHQPDVYEAAARLQVDLENNPPLVEGKNGSVVIRTQGDETAYLNTQLLLLRSPAFLRRVVKTLRLEQAAGNFSWDSGRRNSTWANVLRLAGLTKNPAESQKEIPLRPSAIAPSSGDGDMDQALTLDGDAAAIRTDLDVKLAETSRLINITFRHSNPNSAAKVTNVIADTFVQANWERRVSSTSSAGEFLKKRIEELHAKISENEKRLIEYAKEHQVFPLDSGRDIQSDRLAALDRGLLEAENARKAAESEYQAALAPGAAASIVDGSPNLQLSTSAIETRLADLRQRRAVMLIEAGENWPEVKELDRQIADLEILLKNTRERAISVVLTNLETRYRQALAREQSLRKAFEQQHSETMTQNAAAIDYRMIQHETTTYRALLDSLLQRSKENDVVLAATPNNVQVTDYATRPVVPVGPRRSLIVLMAFAASLAFGVGFAVFIGSLEDSMPVDSVERVERMFGLPTLAVIPEAKRRRQLRGFQMLQRRNGNGNGFAGLLLHEESGSPIVEAYRKLRTSVLLSNSDHALTTLLVTSSLPAEGKSTAVINLGFVLAQTGARVLLIDGDLRHPSLHEMLGASNEEGLSTILSGNLGEAEVMSMIQQHEGSSLYVLPSGPAPDNPAELLGSERMRRLLKTLNSTFSHIIIDSAPISFFTDAVLVSSIVDGVLMVVRGPKSPRQVARYSLQSLDAAGAPILGVVLNAVDMRTNNYSYYRHYYRRLSP